MLYKLQNVIEKIWGYNIENIIVYQADIIYCERSKEN